jgi:Mlc titration factor MtfA (ptsG expression regulator)
MIVTPEVNRRNHLQALAGATVTAAAGGILGLIFPPLFAGLVLAPVVWWLLRRRVRRRLAVMRQPFPPAWEQILQTHVAYFRALCEADRERFRQMVKVFLDEVRITGIKTDVDDTCRVLVAASAVIPVFGFHDWDYHRLGEVLLYPASFDHDYRTQGGAGANILGMVGLKHLSGVMILSKPSLLEGFAPHADKENVGIHEFAHLVEREEAEGRGLPPEVPREVVKQWVAYVARELARPSRNRAHINSYAYTNEAEFFAVLTEYFFTSPEKLRHNDPTLYQMLRQMFQQDPLSLRKLASGSRCVYGGNAPCPCGGGKKYRECCGSRSDVLAVTSGC